MVCRKTHLSERSSCCFFSLFPLRERTFFLVSFKRVSFYFNKNVLEKNDQTRSKENHKQTIPSLPFSSCVRTIERNYVALFVLFPTTFDQCTHTNEISCASLLLMRTRENFWERNEENFPWKKNGKKQKKISLTRSSVNFVEWKRSIVEFVRRKIKSGKNIEENIETLYFDIK